MLELSEVLINHIQEWKNKLEQEAKGIWKLFNSEIKERIKNTNEQSCEIILWASEWIQIWYPFASNYYDENGASSSWLSQQL